MDKKQALKTLIIHNYSLSDSDKEKLLGKLPAMEQEEIDALGTFFAKKKKSSLKHNEEIIAWLEKLKKVAEEKIAEKSD